MLMPPALATETLVQLAELPLNALERHVFAAAARAVTVEPSEKGTFDPLVEPLAMMLDPRAIDESRRILETSNDVTWNRAATRVLGAMDQREMAPRFLEIVKDWKDPLAPAALIALGDLGELQALPAIREALDSRSEEIVVAAAQAAGKLIRETDTDAEALHNQLAGLLRDSSATERMRVAALESLVLIDDPRLNAALASAVTDAGLEGTYLLERIEELLRERKVRLA